MCVGSLIYLMLFFFFFQAEDGIRDYKVTGVQTCALPISRPRGEEDRQVRAAAAADLVRGPAEDALGQDHAPAPARHRRGERARRRDDAEIGRASCRERV